MSGRAPGADSSEIARPPRRLSFRSRTRRPDGQPGIVLICCVVAGAQATWGLVIPVLPMLVDSLSAGTTAMGAAVAAFGLGRLVINIPAGAATNLLNQRAMLVTGTLLVAVSTGVTGFVDSVEQLLALRFATGLGGGIVITTGMTMLSSTEPTRLGATMSTLQTFQMAGGALGPAIGGLLVGAGTGTPFIACGVFLGLLAVAGIFLPLPQWRRQRTQAAAVTEPGASVWTRGLVAVSLVGFTVFLVRFGGQQFMFPVLAYDRANMSPELLGGAITGATVFSLLLVRRAGKATDRWGPRPMVIISSVAVGVTTLGFLASTTPALFIAALVATSAAMVLTGPSTGAFLASSVPPRKRGTAVGIYRTAGDVAILIGPLALGTLIEQGHTTVAICLLSLISGAAAAVFTILTRSTPRDNRGGTDNQYRGVTHAGEI